MVFLFGIILIIIAILIGILVVYNSLINVELKKIEFKICDSRKIQYRYYINIKVLILKKIPVFKYKIELEKNQKKLIKNKKKVNKLENMIMKKINNKVTNEINHKLKEIKQLKNIHSFDIEQFSQIIFGDIKKKIYILNILNESVNKLNINIQCGTKNPINTSYIIVIISTILSIYYKKYIKEVNKSEFLVEPKYLNQNIFNLDLSGVISIRIKEIIHIINMFKNKKGVKKYERTSNRRSYAYSHE